MTRTIAKLKLVETTTVKAQGSTPVVAPDSAWGTVALVPVIRQHHVQVTPSRFLSEVERHADKLITIRLDKLHKMINERTKETCRRLYDRQQA